MKAPTQSCSTQKYETYMKVLQALFKSKGLGAVITLDELADATSSALGRKNNQQHRNSVASFASKLCNGTAADIKKLKTTNPETYKHREYLLTDTTLPFLGVFEHAGRGCYKLVREPKSPVILTANPDRPIRITTKLSDPKVAAILRTLNDHRGLPLHVQVVCHFIGETNTNAVSDALSALRLIGITTVIDRKWMLSTDVSIEEES